MQAAEDPEHQGGEEEEDELDEDYIPSEAGSDSDEVGSDAEEDHHSPPKKRKKKHHEGPAALTEVLLAKGSSAEKQPDGKKAARERAAAEEEKKKRDELEDMWAEMNEGIPAPTKPVPKPVAAMATFAAASATPAVMKQQAKKKLVLEETYGFAGEEVKFTMTLDPDSEEARRALARPTVRVVDGPEEFMPDLGSSTAAPASGTSGPVESSSGPAQHSIAPGAKPSSPEDKSSETARPNSEQFSKARRSAGGLDALVSGLGGKKQLSTLSKSAIDWEVYKDKSGLADELAQVITGAGYLEKQAFLDRTEWKRFEIEKDARDRARAQERAAAAAAEKRA